MSVPAPYPRQTLPDWPTPVRRGSNEDQERQVVVDALPGLGFKCLFDDTFVSLDTQIRARQRKKSARETTQTTQEHFQLWQHPSGIIVSVERFRRSDTGKWNFNQVWLAAQETKGHGLSVILSGSYRPSHSRQQVPLHGLHGTDDFATLWLSIQHAAQEGRLAPLEEWNTVPLSDELLTKQARHYALPKTISDTTPQAASQLRRTELARLAPSLGKQRLRALDRLLLPEPQKLAWRRFIAQAVIEQVLKDDALSVRALSDQLRVDPAAKTVLPRWAVKAAGAQSVHAKTPAGGREKYRRDRAGWLLHGVLEDFGMPPGEHLFPEERTTLHAWIDVLSDPRHPRLIQDKLQAASRQAIARFGMGFEHALAAAGRLPGGPRKMGWWQAQQSPEALMRACREEDASGKTLPMRLTTMWLETPNARANRRRFLACQAHVRLCLDHLAQLAPTDQWTLETSRHALWDEALAPHVNASVDEDLIAQYRANLASCLEWWSTTQTPANVFLPDREKPVSLLDHKALLTAIKQSEKLSPRGDASDRIGMIAPLLASIQYQALSCPAPSVRPAARSRL